MTTLHCENCGHDFEFELPSHSFGEPEKIILHTGKNCLTRPSGEILAECPRKECGSVFDPADQ